jgi:molybdate transport system substrate-binding protein
VTVTFSFGASSTLAQQIESGSPGDVFASADERTMNSVAQASDVRGTPKIFALNKLEIAVAPGDPKRIAGLADLARRDLQVALCAPQVPCGAFAAQALARARVTVPRASQEQDVKAVLTKVRLGEADAGIVYATDVRAAGSSVAGVAIPDSLNVVARYPIVLLRSASPAAQGFVDFVLSPAGAAILRRYGFSIP